MNFLAKGYGLILVLTTTAFFSFGQSSIMSFESLTTDDGLSQSVVTAICEDDNHIIWVGTQNGLNRIIGREVTVFHRQIRDSLGLPSDQIQTLHKGPNGKIWIGTSDVGLVSLEPATGKFQRYEFYDSLGSLMNISAVKRITFNADGQLLAAAGANGLLVLDPKKKHGLSFPVQSPQYGRLNVTDVLEDNGQIWLATTNHGLVCFDPDKGIIKQLFDAKHSLRWNYNEITRIVPAEYPWFFVGTFQNSLYKVNRETGESIPFADSPAPIFHHANITDLLYKGKDSLLMATSVGGLYMLDIPAGKTKILSQSGIKNGISYNNLSCLYMASNGILWAGTNGRGLAFHHPGTNRFRVYSALKPADFKLSFESVRSIYADQDYVFIGGYYGINRVDKKTGEIRRGLDYVVPYRITPLAEHPDELLIGSEGSGTYVLNKNLKILSSHGNFGFGFYSDNELIPFVLVFAVEYLRNNEYLIGHTGGMAIYDYTTKSIVKNFTHSADTNSIVAGEIKSILIDSKKRVWVGSATGGLCFFDTDTEDFQSLNHQNGSTPLPSQMILDLFEDRDHRIWVGTMNGLCLLSPEGNIERIYTKEDGLPDNSIVSIEQSKNGNIWMGTNEGLSELNPENGFINNFGTLHGLPGQEMNRGASFSDDDGTLYFGGVDGLVSFHLDSVYGSIPKPIPQVVAYYEFNNIKLTDSLLPYSKLIVVPPGVEYFSIEVSGADVFFDEQNQFQYKVAGIYNDWVNNGRSRRITFNNVEPGTYEVGLRVSNDGSNWVENPCVVQLIVKPTFWQTHFAKFLFVFVLGFLVIASFYLRTIYFRKQKIELNKLVEQRTRQLSESELSLKKANESKDRFFSILAHDLRSPFNSLLGLSELVAHNWDEYSDPAKKKMTGSIYTTVHSLFRLINNLLDWSRLQMDAIQPEIGTIPICQLVREVLETQQIVLSSKKIRVELYMDESLHVWADSNMTETILRNLLTNAVKFSNEEGSIELSVKSDPVGIKIQVKDYGVGISKENQTILFDSMQTFSTQGTRGEKGTGLGLLLCHEFVQKMGGKIEFRSEPGKGSEFWVILPAVKE
jgi:signal transduction histidine kinase/ligand-binding sensor domain-containing protein